jgi:hypothetical protein
VAAKRRACVGSHAGECVSPTFEESRLNLPHDSARSQAWRTVRQHRSEKSKRRCEDDDFDVCACSSAGEHGARGAWRDLRAAPGGARIKGWFSTALLKFKPASPDGVSLPASSPWLPQQPFSPALLYRESSLMRL